MFIVNTKKCIGCGECVRDCVYNDIEMLGEKAFIRNENCISCGHCIAICPKNAVSTDEYDMNDVAEYNKRDFDIDEDNLLNFIKFRRTVRQFKGTSVSDKKILKIIEAGRFTQTASNLQEVSYIVVKEDNRELLEMALESLKEKADLILADKSQNDAQLKRFADLWINMYDEFQNEPNTSDRLFFNAPVVIVVTANTDINGALASSNMGLMTHALGLGTIFSGFFVRAARSDKKILDFLGVKEGHKIVTCMAIGHPDVKYHRTVPRKKADIIWK